MSWLRKYTPWLLVAMIVGGVAYTLVFVAPMLAVASGSMEPTLPTGSRIIIHQQDDYRPGDIITFTRDGELVTHRLIEIREDGEMITKGDANLTADVWSEPLNENHVLGKVIYMTPLTTLGFWSSPLGVAIIACLVIATVALRWRFDDNEVSEGAEVDEESVSSSSPV